jgi:hypothetical protein
MLGALASGLAALPQEAVQFSLAPKPAEALLCVSTAPAVKTATCNDHCNSHRSRCPEACFCLATSNKSVDVQYDMPSEEFERLSDRLATGDAVPAGIFSLLNQRSCADEGEEVGKGDDALPCCDDLEIQERESERDGVKVKAQVCSAGRRQVSVALPSKPASQSVMKSRVSSSRPATLPKEDVLGFYMKTWACKKASSVACIGPDNKNINVAFSGEATIEKALMKSLKQGNDCAPYDKRFCNNQIRYMRPGKKGSQVASREDAIKIITAEGSWTEEQCKGCFLDDLNQTAPLTDAAKHHPFSPEAGLHRGVQFLSIGGASQRGVLTRDSLKSFFRKGLDKVKDAGFQGVCFDIELTKGEEGLVAEFERAFAACKKEGLLVMVTTSHTAPYAAAPRAKELFVDAWVKSENIDIFSPQLYTNGYETSPEYTMTPCRSAGGLDSSKCTWERLKPMKAKIIPSLASDGHYADVKRFFAEKGITTQGYFQWKDPSGALVPDPEDVSAADAALRAAMPAAPGTP